MAQCHSVTLQLYLLVSSPGRSVSPAAPTRLSQSPISGVALSLAPYSAQMAFLTVAAASTSEVPSYYIGAPMQLSKKITQNTSIRDFINLQRYQNHQPSIYNAYFGINLLTTVDKLPPVTRQTLEGGTTEVNLHDGRTDSKGLPQSGPQTEIEHKVMAYTHEVDRLGQDIQINQYVITNVLLGRGAHSSVRLAKSEDRFFAIKIIWFDKIKKKYFLKQRQLSRLVNAEINLLRRLRHRNIIALREAIYAADKERMFIVLEYCSKGSLLTIMNNRLTVELDEWEGEVRGYFGQMVAAMQFIHGEEVIHRDIKPENMLVNEHGELKVIDFNISEVLNEDETVKVTNKFIGTKGYAAPELIIDTQVEKIVKGKAIDIWALGITLLQILEKKHPFNIKNMQDLKKHLSREVPLNESYSSDLRSLLSGMLQIDWRKRISITEIAKHPWLRGK